MSKSRRWIYRFFRHCHALPWFSQTALGTRVMHCQVDVLCHLSTSPHPTLGGKYIDYFLLDAHRSSRWGCQAIFPVIYWTMETCIIATCHFCPFSWIPWQATWRLSPSGFSRWSLWGGRENITWLYTLINSLWRPFSLRNYHLSQTSSSIVWSPLEICLGSLSELQNNLSPVVICTEKWFLTQEIKSYSFLLPTYYQVTLKEHCRGGGKEWEWEQESGSFLSPPPCSHFSISVPQVQTSWPQQNWVVFGRKGLKWCVWLRTKWGLCGLQGESTLCHSKREGERKPTCPQRRLTSKISVYTNALKPRSTYMGPSLWQ